MLTRPARARDRRAAAARRRRHRPASAWSGSRTISALPSPSSSSATRTTSRAGTRSATRSSLVGQRGHAGDHDRGARRRAPGRRDPRRRRRGRRRRRRHRVSRPTAATRTRSPSGSRCWRRSRAARRRMGETGRAQMLQRYAVARLVDDVDRLYRALLATAVGHDAPVARERDLAIGLALDVLAPARAHLVEVVQRRPRSRRGSTPATSSARPGGTTSPQPDLSTSAPSRCPRRPRRAPVARRPGSRRAGSGRRSPPDRARARRSGGRRRRATAGAPRAAGRARKRIASVTSSRCARRVSSPWRAPKPAITMTKPVEVSEERRRADEAVEILRVTDVAGVHDHERVRRARAPSTSRCRAAAA